MYYIYIIIMTDNIYYDAAIVNNSEEPKIAYYEESRSDPLIADNMTKYELSIIRFSIPVTMVPIFNFIPQGGALPSEPVPPGNQNPDLGIYSITFSYQGVDKQVYLELDGKNIPTSLSNITRPNNWYNINAKNYLYYSVYSYSYFINLINVALAKIWYYCLNNAPFNTSPAVILNSPCPFMEYDAATGLISLYASKNFSSSHLASETIKIYFNHPLYDFFQNFPKDGGSFDQPNGKFFQFRIQNTGTNLLSLSIPHTVYTIWKNYINYNVGDLVSYDNINYICTAININKQPDINPAFWNIVPNMGPPAFWSSIVNYVIGDKVYFNGQYYVATAANLNTPPLCDCSGANPWNIDTSFICYKITQEFDSRYLWSILSSVRFESNSIGTQNEFIPNFNLTGQIQNTDNYRQILLDYIPNVQTPADNRAYLQYTPTAEYRMVDIKRDSPLYRIDFNINWVDRQQNVYPLYIDRKTSASIKFLFRKKVK